VHGRVIARLLCRSWTGSQLTTGALDGHINCMGKGHHYVPHFYLNAFSSAPRRIHVFNLPRRLAVPDASLRDQCWAHRLYGPDDRIENDLAVIENGAASVIKAVLATGKPPSRPSDDHHILLTFVALQLGRTLAAQANTERMSSLLGTAVFDGAPPDDWTLTPDQALDLAPSTTSTMRDSIADLGITVVAATDGAEFTTSDNPVFRYNQYCEGINYFGVTGTTARGFQIFYPLSSNLLVVLFDFTRNCRRTSKE
jgi:Protein of unknown function (DUF4238)